MNRFAKIVALSLVAVLGFGCEKQDKIDQGGVIIVISDYDFSSLLAIMSASEEFPVFGSGEASVTVRSQARNSNTPTSQLMDVLIEGYVIEFRRGDTGTRVPPRLNEPVGGLVPVNGTMTQNGVFVMRQDQFETGIMRDMRLLGRDPETNSTLVRMIWSIRFHGRTISGELAETPAVSFNLDIEP